MNMVVNDSARRRVRIGTLVRCGGGGGERRELLPTLTVVAHCLSWGQSPEVGCDGWCHVPW